MPPLSPIGPLDVLVNNAAGNFTVLVTDRAMEAWYDPCIA
jgi:hypothetical protein